jgi:hypothetical protein
MRKNGNVGTDSNWDRKKQKKKGIGWRAWVINASYGLKPFKNNEVASLRGAKRRGNPGAKRICKITGSHNAVPLFKIYSIFSSISSIAMDCFPPRFARGRNDVTLLFLNDSNT